MHCDLLSNLWVCHGPFGPPYTALMGKSLSDIVKQVQAALPDEFSDGTANFQTVTSIAGNKANQSCRCDVSAFTVVKKKAGVK